MYKKLRKVFKYVLLSGLVLWLLAEVALRIFYHEQLKLREYPQIYNPDHKIGYRYIPNRDATIDMPSISKDFRINNQGFYGPDFDTQKKEGVFRIAVVGSSQATGIWLDSEESFSMKLEKLLQDQGKPVEVINLSIDGRFRDEESIILAEELVPVFNPDLVLISTSMPFVRGDVFRDIYRGYVMIYSSRKFSKSNCMRRIDYLERHTFLKTLYNISYCARAACRYYRYHYPGRYSENLEIFIEKRIQADRVSFQPWASNVSAHRILKLDTLVREQGGQMFVFNYRPDAFFEEISQMYCIPYLPLNIPVDDNSLHHELDIHFNDKGHQEIAEQFRDSLLARDVIHLPVPTDTLGDG